MRFVALGGMQLTGPIPANLAQLPLLYLLSVTNNSLSGEFPASFRFFLNFSRACSPVSTALVHSYHVPSIPHHLLVDVVGYSLTSDSAIVLLWPAAIFFGEVALHSSLLHLLRAH